MDMLITISGSELSLIGLKHSFTSCWEIIGNRNEFETKFLKYNLVPYKILVNIFSQEMRSHWNTFSYFPLQYFSDNCHFKFFNCIGILTFNLCFSNLNGSSFTLTDTSIVWTKCPFSQGSILWELGCLGNMLD